MKREVQRGRPSTRSRTLPPARGCHRARIGGDPNDEPSVNLAIDTGGRPAGGDGRGRAGNGAPAGGWPPERHRPPGLVRISRDDNFTAEELRKEAIHAYNAGTNINSDGYWQWNEDDQRWDPAPQGGQNNDVNPVLGESPSCP